MTAAGIALAVLAVVGEERAAVAAAAHAITAPRVMVAAFGAALAVVAVVAVRTNRESGHEPPRAARSSHEATAVASAPPTLANTAAPVAPVASDVPATPVAADGSATSWATRTIRNIVGASDDPIETCRRGVSGLAIAALSPPDGHARRAPSEHLLERAAELADRVAPSCEGESWPELYAICEASPIDVLDGNVSCYPYDVFD